MRNITFSADENLIMLARQRAASERRTLNELFREWLASYAIQAQSSDRFDLLMQQLEHIEVGRSFSRDEMNERR